MESLAPADAGPLPLRVVIEDNEKCPRYAAAVADVGVGPSPAWLAARLEAAGVRPINNIVDITNYVMLELGQPLHAFDYTMLAGQEVRVRRAGLDETVTTLDGVDRALEPDMLVIADAERAQAVAGVMGGRASEVSGHTTVVVLESAYFQPGSVRRTARRLALSTEASYRFERGANIEMPVMALGRVATLMEQAGAGRLRPGVTDVYPAPRLPFRVSSDTSASRASSAPPSTSWTWSGSSGGSGSSWSGSMRQPSRGRPRCPSGGWTSPAKPT